MFIPMRRFLGIVLGAAAFWSMPSQQVQAQIAPGLLNPYVNPFAAQGLFNAAALGPTLQGRAILAGAGPGGCRPDPAVLQTRSARLFPDLRKWQFDFVACSAGGQRHPDR